MMKKLLVLIVLIALCGGVAQAKDAQIVNERVCPHAKCMRDFTPFALTLAGPVGLPWGDWEVCGLQIGLFNSLYSFSGVQVGIVNVADHAYGMQIGVINVITTDDVPFLPIVNWCF